MARGAVTVLSAAVLMACGGRDAPAPAGPPPWAALQGWLADACAQVQGLPGSIAPPGGQMEVWLVMDQPPLAQAKAKRAEELGLKGGAMIHEKRAAASASPATASLKAAAVAQRWQLRKQQSDVAARVQALGGRPLGSVEVAHNAMAVRIAAGRLAELEALPGVVKVRPVVHYQLALGETVPHVGAAALQRAGLDGGTSGAAPRSRTR